jgi:hypothetical protein
VGVDIHITISVDFKATLHPDMVHECCLYSCILVLLVPSQWPAA